MIQFFEKFLTMAPRDIFIQVLGIIATVCIILSFQFKKNSGYFTMQAIGCFLFTVHYALLGSWAGVLMDGLGALRVVILLFGEKVHKPWVLWVMLASFTGATAVIIAKDWDAWIGIFPLAVFPFISQIANTLGNWTGNPNKIRIAQLCIISPGWLVYNILISPPSIGGIICESFNMISVIVFFVRMRIEKRKETANIREKSV